MNKKGDITDMLVFVVILFVLFVGFFILSFVIPFISEGLETAGLNSTSEGARGIQAIADIGSKTINQGAFFLFFGLSLSVFITSFFARTHPLFLFLYIFFLIITIIVGVYLGNAYQDMANNAVFSGFTGPSLINLVMNNLIKITVGVAALSFVLLFAKFKPAQKI